MYTDPGSAYDWEHLEKGTHAVKKLNMSLMYEAGCVVRTPADHEDYR